MEQLFTSPPDLQLKQMLNLYNEWMAYSAQNGPVQMYDNDERGN